MLRRGCLFLAGTIPRSAWDPQHHNVNWSDSFGGEIAARRQWPSKKWSVGLEPRTPHDWLQHSKRNLAYGYNGALRACSTFSEMLVLYNEMKLRHVLVDVDTMHILLSRGARQEGVAADDLFLLFEELVSLGARPDVAVVEMLHTILDHSGDGLTAELYDVRRRELVEWYNRLAVELIGRLRPESGPVLRQPMDALLAQQLQHLRTSLKALKASLSPHVYRQLFPCLTSSSQLLTEVNHFLWELVHPQHPSTSIAALKIRVPFVATVVRRPSLPGQAVSDDVRAALSPLAPSGGRGTAGSSSPLKATDFEDSDVCSVLLAAVERVVEGSFSSDPTPISLRRMYLSLLSVITSTGVLYTADLMAQLMDIVKYSEDGSTRETDATRLLRYALRGSSASQDEAYRRLWQHGVQGGGAVDGRVIGRYLASRDPWSALRIHYDQRLQFTHYDVEPAAELKSSAGDADGQAPASSDPLSPFTAESLALRWKDVKAIIQSTGVLDLRGSSPSSAEIEAAMEVFTGQMVFLRTVATGGSRYESTEGSLATQVVGGELQQQLLSPSSAGSQQTLLQGGQVTLPMEVWEQLYTMTADVYAEMQQFMEQHPTAEPEFECWEALLITLRSIMDHVASSRSSRSNKKAHTAAAAEAGEELFANVAALRDRLLHETVSRFNGRFRILWLQEC